MGPFISKDKNISTEWPGRRKCVREMVLDIKTGIGIREAGLGGLNENRKRILVINKNQELNTYESPRKRKRLSTIV